MDFLVKALPVHDVRHPGQRVGKVEEAESDLPRPVERVDEEQVPTEGHRAIVQAVGIFEVDGRVFDIIAAVEQEFTLAIELDRL